MALLRRRKGAGPPSSFRSRTASSGEHPNLTLPGANSSAVHRNDPERAVASRRRYHVACDEHVLLASGAPLEEQLSAGTEREAVARESGNRECIEPRVVRRVICGDDAVRRAAVAGGHRLSVRDDQELARRRSEQGGQRVVVVDARELTDFREVEHHVRVAEDAAASHDEFGRRRIDLARPYATGGGG